MSCNNLASLPVLLKNPRILLLGGGSVALRKARTLHDHKIRFCLLSRECLPEISSLGLTTAPVIKQVEASDLATFNIIVDATGNPDVAALILAEKQKRFLLVNIVDDPARCDFFFSALINRGQLKIAVSTDGVSPTLAQTVRDRIESLIPADMADFVAEKGLSRVSGRAEPAIVRQEALSRMGQVDLVGCGPGNPDLLTIRAYDSIQKADVVLYDHLIPPQILAMVPKRTEKVYVGKQKQNHGIGQEQINQLIISFIQRGLRVARLKSGDPYVFGRGAEEAEFLVQKGLRVNVIPGITSAVAAPAAAGIPLTARGYSTNVSIVSGHLAGSRLNTAWLPLLKIPNHTIVVLMGISFAPEIAKAALRSGVCKKMPVAIISHATRPEQKTLVTTLELLAKDAERAEKPAVMVFGQVVTLHSHLPNSP